MAEKILIEGLKNGTEESYRKLIEIHGSKLLQTCYLILRDRHEAEDVVQDTFIRVFRSINNFKGESSLYTWIYSIAVNNARDRLRSRKEFVELSRELSDDGDLESEYVEEIDKESLRRAVHEMSTIYREVLVLYYFRSFSIPEISKMTGESQGTIKSRLSRGRKQLGDSLRKGGVLDGR